MNQSNALAHVFSENNINPQNIANESSSIHFDQLVVPNNTADTLAITTPMNKRHIESKYFCVNNLEHTTKTLPVNGENEPPVRSSGWTLELMTVYLRFMKVEYDKDVFPDNFYWDSFGAYFNLSDTIYDWLAMSYFEDDKTIEGNIAFIRIYSFYISQKLQELYNGYFGYKTGLRGYIKNLLEKNPIAPEKLNLLEAKFAVLGREMELNIDITESFAKLSPERQEFYYSNNPKKQEILANNILTHLKNNPYILQRNPALNEVINNYESNNSSKSFYEFLTDNTHNYDNRAQTLYSESYKLYCYIEKLLSANYRLHSDAKLFYSISKNDFNAN